MVEARFTTAALDDVERIYNWIAADSPIRAIDQVDLIFQVCELLAGCPQLGARFSEKFRHFSKRPWIIVYQAFESDVLIHRIFDGRQNWRVHIAENRSD